MRNVSGRIPVEVVEIDQDFCDHTYGNAPCQASLSDGGRKCFNTIKNCQDLQNYQPGVLTLRLCTMQQDMPVDEVYFPFLRSVRIDPAEINPGGGDQGRSLLGRRAGITVTASDHPASDRYLDKYFDERISGAAQLDGIGYDPTTRSTFWRKWRARNLYYLHRPLRYITGYLENGEIVDAVTRHYVITGFSGPDQNGKVSIQGADILTLAQRQKAQAPVASPGKLSVGISESFTALTLTPPGVGQAYPATGYVRVGEEVMGFTRSGDTMTITRAQFNTVAEEHSDGDTVQLCWHVNGLQPRQILYELLNGFAGIDDVFLDTAQWENESITRGYLTNSYSALITEPMNVEDLLNEIFEEMYFFCWFDERIAKVRIMAVRPSDGTPLPVMLNSDENFLADSVRVDDKGEEVITRVVVNYGLRNPAVGLDEPSNYRVTDVFVDLEEEGEDRSRTSRTRTINSRWLSRFAGAQVQQLANRIMARYRVPPVRVTFSLDAKDRDLWLADFVRLTCPDVVDDVGAEQVVEAQIIRAEETVSGTTFSYTAEISEFAIPPDPNWRPVHIPFSENNLNLRAAYDEHWPTDPPADSTVVFIVRSGVVVGSSSVSTPSVVMGTWPSDVTLVLLVEPGAHVVGLGGVGGDGGTQADRPGKNGGAGGVAILVTRPLSIDNRGIIGGGGGGGGGGGETDQGSGFRINGGVGGGGAAFGPRGAIGTTFRSQDGGLEVGGNGGQPFGGGSGAAGRGGNGGDLGQAGGSGNGGTGSGGSAPGLGGAPGAAIDGVSNVTFISRGIIRGPEIN